MLNKLLFIIVGTMLLVNSSFAILPSRDTINPGQDTTVVINSSQTQTTVTSTSTSSGKSQIIAFVLALVAGIYGAHNFYLGYKKKGTTQLILALGGVGSIFIGAFIPIFGLILMGVGFLALTVDSVWALIDMIKILTGDLKPASGDYSETL